MIRLSPPPWDGPPLRRNVTFARAADMCARHVDPWVCVPLGAYHVNPNPPAPNPFRVSRPCRTIAARGKLALRPLPRRRDWTVTLASGAGLVADCLPARPEINGSSETWQG